jgi:serine protease
MRRLLDRLTLLQSWAVGVVLAVVLAATGVPAAIWLRALGRPPKTRAWQLTHPGDGQARLVVDLDLAKVQVSIVRKDAGRPGRGPVTVRAAGRRGTIVATRSDRLQAALAALARVQGVTSAVQGQGDQAIVAAEPGTRVDVAPFVRGVRTAATARALDLTQLPGDPYMPYAWHLRNDGSGTPAKLSATAGADIGALAAWRRARGAGAVVAVVDTGADLSVPELAAHVWTDPQEPCGSATDKDGDGLVGDCHGWNFYLNSADVTNTIGGSKASQHGTAVSGAAAGIVGNDTGAGGVAPEATIMPLVAGYGTVIYMTYAAKAIRYAVDHGADVVNLSFGGARSSPVPDDLAVRDAIRYAADHNVLVVAAAGNDAANRDTSNAYPASFREPNMLAVGASTATDARASFSAYGSTTVDLFAPGTSIIAPDLGGGYRLFDGTSLSSPLVAGTAALMWSTNPSAPYATIRQAILSATARRSAFAGRSVSGGRLDAGAAVAAMPDPVAVRFTGLSGLSVSSPAQAMVTVSGTGDGLPAGPLQLRLDLLARVTGSTFTVAGATIDAADAGTATTDAAGAVLLEPPGLTAAALSTGVTVPLGFTLPAGRYAFAVRLVSAGTPVSSAQFGVFDVSGGAATPTTVTTSTLPSTTTGTSSTTGSTASSAPPSATSRTTSASTTSTSTTSTSASTAATTSRTTSASTTSTSTTSTTATPTGTSTMTTGPPPTQTTPTATTRTTTQTSTTATRTASPIPSGPRTDYPGGTPLWGITYLAPPSGPATGGGRLTIGGTALPDGATVQFGSTNATTVSQAWDQLVVTIPPHDAGTADVTVWAPDARSEVLRGAFTYTESTPSGPTTAPSTRSTTSTTSTTTTTSTTSTTTAPSAPSSTATSTSTSDPSATTVTASTATSSTVTSSTTATTTTATTSSGGFPSANWGITSLSPTSGSTEGGTAVTIQGTRLPDHASVRFGTSSAMVVQQSGDLLVVSVPMAATAGAVDVIVRGVDGRSDVLTKAFTYQAASTPTTSAPTPTATSTATSTTSAPTPTATSTTSAPTPTATSTTSAPTSTTTTTTTTTNSSTASGNGLTLTVAGPGVPSLPSWMWTSGVCATPCLALRG